MEFEKISLEKSWNFVSDLEDCEPICEPISSVHNTYLSTFYFLYIDVFQIYYYHSSCG